MRQDPEGDRGRETPSPEDLAAEFLARKDAGEPVDAAEFLERLTEVGARQEFQDLVAGAGAAERGLPRAITSDSLIAGRYRIREKIGEGGSGYVFSAVDEKLGRDVALKVLKPLARGNREREEMFAKESRVLADLKHPGIVAVHDAGTDGEFTYIVMDLVEGTSIAEVIERTRKELARGARGETLPARDGELLSRAIGGGVAPGRHPLIEPGDWYRSVARILVEIARTLEAAHGKRVIHRDLKPANVMLLGGGAPVVLDFGLAGSPDLSAGSVTEKLYGSVPYLAPEQARDQKVGMDVRTDVYQLGLILYELLTLRRAFPGTAIGEVLHKIEHGDYVLPRQLDPAVPPDLEAICTMALEVSPDRRYPSAQSMREDLERWLEGRAPIASRSARWRTFARTARYTVRRHPAIAAAVGMVLVAAGVGVYAWNNSLDPVVTMRPYRYTPETRTIVPLRKLGEEVKLDDWLGVTIDSNRVNFIYTLSVFGPDGEERMLSPWKTLAPDDMGRAGRDGEKWGLRVPPGEQNRLCTQINQTSLPGTNEGLLVLASPIERPEIERWMSVLQGRRTVSYPEARRALLNEFTSTTRGEPVPKSYTPEQIKNFTVDLGASGYGKRGKRLGLPDVAECEVECRVATK